MILASLREATRDQHAALEGTLPLGRPDLDPAVYRALMGRFWGFYATWEEKAAAYASPTLLPVVLERAKLPLLHRDLLALGTTPEHLPRLDPQQLPDFAASQGTLLGSMYVVEGATLGGQVISRGLERDQGFENGRGYSFFQSYGKAVGQQWKSFAALLETLPETEAPVAAAAARQTFHAFAEWFAA